MPMREMLKEALWQIAGITAVFAAALLWAWVVTNHAAAYTPDHIDLERHANWKAKRTEPNACFWYGYGCPDGRRWRHRYYHHHQPHPDPDLMKAQLRLRELGYRIEADGLTGSETRWALEKFQHDHDLPVTGRLDRVTREALREAYQRPHQAEQPEWTKRPELCKEDDGRECTCEPIIVFSGEHVGKDAQEEAMKRWRGNVRSMLGELFMDWDRAAEPKADHCWFTGTGERTSDRLGQTRCVVQGRACFGPPPVPPVPPSYQRKGGRED